MPRASTHTAIESKLSIQGGEDGGRGEEKEEEKGREEKALSRGERKRKSAHALSPTMSNPLLRNDDDVRGTPFESRSSSAVSIESGASERA